PRLLFTRSSPCDSCSISAVRPTNFVSPRAAAAAKRERTVDAPSISYTSIGSARPFTWVGPTGRMTDVPLSERQGVGGEQRRSRIRQLLHARREMRRLSYRGVIHAQ